MVKKILIDDIFCNSMIMIMSSLIEDRENSPVNTIIHQSSCKK